MRRPSSWRTPRLPISVPRSGKATTSEYGVTRFCSGTGLPPPSAGRHAGRPRPICLTQQLLSSLLARANTQARSGGAAMRLDGLHHVTAITGDAPRNVDFYARVLGLRLTAKTVNQDD